MEITLTGGKKLNGSVEVNSSKNAILPILAASLLCNGKVEVNKVPQIRDVRIISNLINELGVDVKHDNNKLIYNVNDIKDYPSYDLVRQIRASFLVMGPILAKKGKVKISLPGGCAIGTRPIDLHLKGFQALGARIDLNHGDVVAKAEKLIGNHVYLDFPSVGATENIMMAAALASGTTYIENAALEPEVVDLANFINQMGGKVSGAGSNVIKIEGVRELHPVEYTPIPDRIEAGTYMLAGAITGGNITVKNVIPEHIKAITAKLIESGAVVEENENEVKVKRDQEIKPVYLKTLPYPGFPTDMQAQFMAYLSLALGSSIVTESVFENRFMHLQELTRMGANIKAEGRTAVIKGVNKLTGARVKATDLRAGAALVLAGLVAEGSTVICDSHHVDRGYENFVEKLNNLGANITRK